MTIEVEIIKLERKHKDLLKQMKTETDHTKWKFIVKQKEKTRVKIEEWKKIMENPQILSDIRSILYMEGMWKVHREKAIKNLTSLKIDYLFRFIKPQ